MDALLDGQRDSPAFSPLAATTMSRASRAAASATNYYFQTVEWIEVSGAGDPQAVGRAVVESLGAAWGNVNGMGRDD